MLFHLLGWARSQENRARHFPGPHRPLSSCFREELQPQKLSDTLKKESLCSGHKTLDPRTHRGRCHVTQGSGNSDSGYHHQPVTVGYTKVTKQGFRPNLARWCPEQVTRDVNLSFLIHKMGAVTIPLLQGPHGMAAIPRQYFAGSVLRSGAVGRLQCGSLACRLSAHQVSFRGAAGDLGSLLDFCLLFSARHVLISLPACLAATRPS